MGESAAFEDLEDYRLIRLADLVVDIANRLGLDRFDYVGWSWGASIGVHLGARHAGRLTTLTLLDAGHTDVQDVIEWTESSLEDRLAQWEANLQTFAGWDDFLVLAKQRATAWRPALEQRLLAGMEERDGEIVPRGAVAAAAAAFHWVGVERPSEQLPHLGKLGLPVLLVVATRNDTFAQVARFRSAVPAADVVEVDSEHDLLAHAPEETSIVADWLLLQDQPSVA